MKQQNDKRYHLESDRIPTRIVNLRLGAEADGTQDTAVIWIIIIGRLDEQINLCRTFRCVGRGIGDIPGVVCIGTLRDCSEVGRAYSVDFD
ncbi:hypothetical protein D3C71_1411590 [compost metagenome]